MGPFEYDRYLVDQLIRPIANLYRVTPLAVGETPAGPPIAYVRQKKLAIKEHIRFCADEGETQELFHIQAQTWLDTGGSRYDVVDAQDGKIGLLHHVFGKSLLRSTWNVLSATMSRLPSPRSARRRWRSCAARSTSSPMSAA